MPGARSSATPSFRRREMAAADGDVEMARRPVSKRPAQGRVRREAPTYKAITKCFLNRTLSTRGLCCTRPDYIAVPRHNYESHPHFVIIIRVLVNLTRVSPLTFASFRILILVIKLLTVIYTFRKASNT